MIGHSVIGCPATARPALRASKRRVQYFVCRVCDAVRALEFWYAYVQQLLYLFSRLGSMYVPRCVIARAGGGRPRGEEAPLLGGVRVGNVGALVVLLSSGVQRYQAGR